MGATEVISLAGFLFSIFPMLSMPQLKEKTAPIIKVGETFSKKHPCFKIEESTGRPGEGGFVLLKNHVDGEPRIPGDVALDLHLIDQVGSPPIGGTRGTFHLVKGNGSLSIRPDGLLDVETKGISQAQLAAVLKYAQSLGEILASEFAH